uniref:DDE Tnp4 domain-containing protein n=1 Tax=Brassica oleracea var. oleracea TaxID=109376 RepID=A0A0D3ANK3_BRAOL
MSSSSSDEVDEALEEMVDQVVDNFIDSMVHAHPNKPTRRAYIERDREVGHNQLWNDYFKENPTYPPEIFRRRFRMNKPLFLRIVERLTIRILAYGQSGDTYDEYLRLGESTSRLCLENFTNGIIQLFGDAYLRRPTSDDLQRLLDVGEKGQYTRGSGKPTIVLEAVASQDLWICHAFFGLPGTLNDINVLDRSPVFDDILQGRAPKVKFKVNNHTYRMAYYLIGGIYPNWSTFIQSIPLPQGPKAELFAERQESTRKDVERAFGVLQSRFAIVKNSALLWDKEKIGRIMKTCVIFHNMIVENERGGYTLTDTSEFESGESSRSSKVKRRTSFNIGNMLGIRNEVQDLEKHDCLKADLVENVWRKFGNADE